MLIEHYLLLLVGSFFATLMGSLVGVGGGFIIIGILSIFLPINILIPVLAAILASIDLIRAIAFRQYLFKPIFFPFALGCIVGVACGTFFFVTLPEKVIGTGLVALVIVTLFTPLGAKFNHLKHPYTWIGVTHSFLSTIFGFGGLFQSAILRTKLVNLQLTATLATSFLVLEILKINFYMIHGFDYTPYLGIILSAVGGAIPASLIGRKYAVTISDNFYRTFQKAIIGCIAMSILAKVWW
ncbi:MAG: TSUP family transporter [Paraglaciecola chathamensis]|uniref:Probable membrane transporter protein n=2 Tax=Paraglaciecola chathamensis TaxID=368405 RepID=A0A8H9IC78_9ALTE|nr:MULTISPECIES: TSUP family transporter [Paraglaciecola]AEE24417.1 protein of unknown function DUF81 [Glaciecola sp. 4H-3-7+YE-5]GAC06886.1 hypothetical protein GAGA_4053 [Paraglaciecola agarilytica NO2]GGZ74144.1 hypothetical protein GCM10011274_35620 [Paraglaciecola oceanifecundans]